MNHPTWNPLSEHILSEIRAVFRKILPSPGYGSLAQQISDYWIDRLHYAWQNKPERIREKDLHYDPADPLSRVHSRTVIIAYGDSVTGPDSHSLAALDRFISEHFPSASGLHMLPACVFSENRFNDGYFSQIERNRVHPRFGTNAIFAQMMERYYSMTDFVLNHVDIENPHFQAYLDGNDSSGNHFYVFSESEYQERKKAGDFDQIFRPRPFPLFTIFRRRPVDPGIASLSLKEKYMTVRNCLGIHSVADPVIGILAVFQKIRNDQMLLKDDYNQVVEFRQFLRKQGEIDPEQIFTLSKIQETREPPYIFKDSIRTRFDLLSAIGFPPETAERICEAYEEVDPMIFGEPIRAMTTFSHVQVDVNTSTYEGLKMLADDFTWYLGLDLNMLRLDAANYAFKKWKTSCFGLPEVKGLMRILYLSIDAVAPRMVANLEVNDKLSAILEQMADPSAPPPMMYDFHLPCMLPAVFNTVNSDILMRVPKLLSSSKVPEESIRFSVAESHDGKSVRGSLDLLTISERYELARIVKENGGRIKYKSVPQRRLDPREFESICREAGIDHVKTSRNLFVYAHGKVTGGPMLLLKNHISSPADMAESLRMTVKDFFDSPALLFLADKLLYGREPYELCVSTRDSLTRLNDPILESARYLAFYTLAFAMMGRNVRSLFFNDLMGLSNDYQRMEATGELRDIKRTRSEYSDIVAKIKNPDSIHGLIAQGMNQLIHIVDRDPSLDPEGSEAEPMDAENPAIAMVHNHYGGNHSLTMVNLSAGTQEIRLNPCSIGRENIQVLEDKFTGGKYRVYSKTIRIDLEPFSRLWLATCPTLNDATS